jgi:hypothetical protein
LAFDRIPTHADAQTQSTATEYIHLGGLFRHQGRLALRQDQDTGHQL